VNEITGSDTITGLAVDTAGDVVSTNGKRPFGYPERTRDKVCIVGFADGHRGLAPFGDDSFEFWGLNRLHVPMPDVAWNRWFELHNLEEFYGEAGPNGLDMQHIEWLRQISFPVYIRRQDLPTAAEWGIQAASPYPLEQVLNDFIPYFTNSVSWLIALAIGMGFSEIHMYGVDMAQDSILHKEYREQRPSCEYFIGLAEGRGIKVVLPDGADLLVASHMYGFEDGGPYLAKMRARLVEIAQRKEAIRAEMLNAQNAAAQMQAQINQLDGAMQEGQYQMTNLMTQVERIE